LLVTRRIVLFALSLLLLPSAASAYCRTTTCPDCAPDSTGCPTGGVPIAWASGCVSYAVSRRASRQASPEDFVRAADAAFATWRDVTCPAGGHPSILPGAVYGSATCNRHEYNSDEPNANIILFRDDAWPYSTSTNALAITSVTFDMTTGEIYDVDMELNGSQPISVTDLVPADSYDLQSVLTHEAGHFLGLAHSPDVRATMWHEYLTGSSAFRRLSQDDVNGICAAYPPERVAACDYRPKQGFSPECGMAENRAGMCSVGRVAPRAADGAAWAAAACALASLFRRPRRASPRAPAVRT
jgi:hypothetical protein